MTWSPTDLPRQDGRIVVVTGANAGLGYFISEQLATTGARVILACRSAERADAAARAIRGRVAGANVGTLALDVSDLASVRTAAAALLDLDRLDVLVENAGIVHPPARRRVSVDGNELVLATNFLGHFALTALVLPALLRTPGSRVVTLGSLASRLTDSKLDDLQLIHGYGRWRAYAQSKVAVQSFGFELDRRFRAAGADAAALVAHPGYSIGGRTPGIRGVNEPGRGARFVDNLQGVFAQGKDRGAWAPVRASADPSAAGGSYWGPLLLTRGRPVLQHPTRTSLDPDVASRLFVSAERYTQVPFPL